MIWDFLVKNAATGYDGNRLHPDIPVGTYGKIPALSYSILKTWMKLQHTPSEFPWWLEHRFDEPPSHALIVGGIVDCLLVGPEVSSRYVVLPPDAPKKPNGRQVSAKNPSPDTIAAVAFWHQIAEKAKYRTIATHDEFTEASLMADAVRNAETNRDVFKYCRKMVATTTLWGEPFKAEFDLWSSRTDQIMDVKTAQDVTPEAFGKAFFGFGYNIQASLYLRIAEEVGHPRQAFSFLCVKNSPPYTTISYSFRPHEDDDHAIIYARTLKEIEGAVYSLREAKTNSFTPNNRWPLLTVPGWEVKKSHDLLRLK